MSVIYCYQTEKSLYCIAFPRGPQIKTSVDSLLLLSQKPSIESDNERIRSQQEEHALSPLPMYMYYIYIICTCTCVYYKTRGTLKLGKEKAEMVAGHCVAELSSRGYKRFPLFFEPSKGFQLCPASHYLKSI